MFGVSLVLMAVATTVNIGAVAASLLTEGVLLSARRWSRVLTNGVSFPLTGVALLLQVVSYFV